MTLKQKLLGAVAVFAALSATQANAQQNMDVTATVPSVCVISNVGTNLTMAFDLSGLAAAAADFTATADFLWRCSAGTAATIALNSGGGGGADGVTRYMTGPGGATLAYSLTAPGGGTWGDGLNGAPVLNVVGAGMALAAEQTTTIDGTVTLANAQAANVGAYTDVVLITMLP